VTPRDIARLAKHFSLDQASAEARFTKYDANEKATVLRHRKDRVFDSACMFLDQKTRSCGVYEARPGVCREYPDGGYCGYYEFLRFEREQQGDPDYVALT
jgi:Fe-S-cluster containining protein